MERAGDDAFAAFEVDVEPGLAIGARHYPADPTASLRAALILGHGAGAGQASVFMVDYAKGLARRGLDVVTFDFPYMHFRRRAPDTNARLEATWRAVLRAASGTRDQGSAAGSPASAVPGPWALAPAASEGPERLFIGGKSMGGRIASQVAAGPEAGALPIAGLVFLGYPLHPPGKLERRRDRHLSTIRQPMLFVQGEQDPFGNAEEIRALVATLPRAELHVVTGAGHSLEPSRGARRGSSSHAAIQDVIIEWIRQVE